MKRSSQLAIRLSKGLGRMGGPTSPRTLERWSQADLGPDDETLSFEGQLEHYLKLGSLSRSGQEAKVTARRMASYGYRCSGLRGALLGFADPIIVPLLDTSSGPDGDASFSFVESEARAMLSHADSLPPMAVKLLRAMLGNAARHSPKLKGEDAVSTLYAVTVSALYHVMGGNFYNIRGVAALLNLDPDEFTPQDQDALDRLERMDFTEMFAAYRTASIVDIVTVAQLLREHGRDALDHIGLSGVTDAQIEEVATTLAPAGVYLIQWAGKHFPDFPLVLPSMSAAA